MQYYAIDGFAFTVPVWTVMQDVIITDDSTVQLGGIVNCEVGGHHAVCLFIDLDLANRFVEGIGGSTEQSIGRFDTAERLRVLLEKIPKSGFTHVTFDAEISTERARQPIAIERDPLRTPRNRLKLKQFRYRRL